MLIKCPRCSTTANLSAAQEGAKVRCGSCERVFVAHPAGERGQRAKSGVPPAAIIAGAVLLAGLALMLLLNREEPKDTLASETKPVVKVAAVKETKRIDPYSFDGEVTQFCLELHRLAHASDRGALRSLLAGDQLLAREVGDNAASAQPFSQLSTLEKSAHLERWSEDLVTGPSSEYIKNWKPYDSEVSALDEDSAKIKLSVSSRDAGDASQLVVLWDLVKIGDKWKVAAWERFQEQDSKPARADSYAMSNHGVQKVLQDDGSVLMEREPEALPHMQETSPELRARIDSLYATMTNLELTREANQAREELIAIGKPVVPKLLTGLFETRLDTQDDSIKANIIVVALRNITGRNMGYQPMALAGAKNTEEHRMSAVRQWFAWWYRFGPKFMEKRQTKDALEDYIELTDKEKRALERDKRKNG